MSRSIRDARSLCALALALAVLACPLGAAPTPVQLKPSPHDPNEPNVEVRFTDGGVMKVRVLDAELPLRTPYGKLCVPLSKVAEIEFATRVPSPLARRIKAAIDKLGHEEFDEREAASVGLSKFGVRAYVALVEAEKSEVAEVRRRARDLLEKLRKAVAEDDLAARGQDVIHTADSKIAGHLEAESIRVETAQFGVVSLKLSDVRSLRGLGQAREEKLAALPDPGSLNQYGRSPAGQVLAFEVVGSTTGNVFGSDVYTLDSSLAAAAVHAGVVRSGQKGVVKVKLSGQVNQFVGGNRNGVLSHTYGPYQGYEIVKR